VTLRAVTAVIAASLLLVGCSDDERRPQGSAPEPELLLCLERAGARAVRAETEIRHVLAAIADERAQNPGFAQADGGRLFVELWEARERSLEWLLWAAQPAKAGEFPDLSVRDILRRAPPRSFVAYLERPQPADVRAADACLDRG
jgi:hypothetical protein